MNVSPTPLCTPLGLQVEVQALEKDAASIKSQSEAATSLLEERRSRLRECDQEIRGLEKDKEKLVRATQDADMEGRRLESK